MKLKLAQSLACCESRDRQTTVYVTSRILTQGEVAYGINPNGYEVSFCRNSSVICTYVNGVRHLSE